MWHLFGRTGKVINVDEETYNQWQMWHLFGRTGEVINVDEETYNQWQMWPFLQDNAILHTARVSLSFHQQQYIDVMPCSSKSPETHLDELSRRVWWISLNHPLYQISNELSGITPRHLVVGIRKTDNLFPEDKVLIKLLYLQFALVENQMYIDLYKCVAFRLSHSILYIWF
jgi:hypothetical protein